MKNKKIILTSTVILLTAILVFLVYLIITKYTQIKAFEKDTIDFANKNPYNIFKISNILYFSSSDSKNKTSSGSHFTVENLYQYTDIAIFIENANSNINLENSLKKLWIENIQIDEPPTLGEPHLYFKSISNFSKSELIEENLITDKLEFNITSKDETKLDNPVLYNNLANPITLSFTNENIKTDYTFTDTSTPITYDGSLLKKANVSLSDITCKLSFDIYIVNNLDQQFKSKVFIDIPLEQDNESIYDGKIVKKEKVNYLFYQE